MTTALYWRQVSKNDKRVGDIQLKNLLRNRFGYPHVLNQSDIDYLKGLDDAGVEGAMDLIEALSKCNEIEIFEES
jgi:hypothetical protein